MTEPVQDRTPTLADLREAADHARARIDPLVFEDGPLAQATAHEAADALVADLERMGTPALVWEGDALPEGAPSWWDFKTLQPKRRA